MGLLYKSITCNGMAHPPTGLDVFRGGMCLSQYIISCGYLILHIFERIPKDNLHTGRIPFAGSSSTRELRGGNDRIGIYG
jgi:hypothetical protein